MYLFGVFLLVAIIAGMLHKYNDMVRQDVMIQYQTPRTVFVHGQWAYGKTIPINANPYVDENLRRAWYDGWLAARNASSVD